jgi:SAM-dependent methyltransferase
MTHQGVELVCPACRSDLVDDASDAAGENRDGSLRCAGCSRTFPVVLGIPDLRLWPDPYIGLEDDRAKARLLDERCRGLGFEESVELYYALTSVVPPFQARRFARSLAAAPDRAAAMFDDLEKATGWRERGPLLDLGCGTAPLLISVARTHESVVGIDVALRWLVMARKRLETQGVAAPLICACAEALPFRDGSFTRAVADSTLEHLRDQERSIAECARVLRPGGSLFVATPNRRSLGPDPHTGLPAGGWLPEALTAAYVRRKGGIPPARHLLTARSLRSLLRSAGFPARGLRSTDETRHRCVSRCKADPGWRRTPAPARAAAPGCRTAGDTVGMRST